VQVAFWRRKALPEMELPAAGSLAEALGAVPDPRRPYGWRPGHEPIPLVALLQLTVVALLCGARSQLAVAQWGRERRDDDPELLEALGLPPGRSPCVATLHRVYKQVDVAAFETALGAWLAQTGSTPRATPTPWTKPVRPVREGLAIDGKVLRGSQPKREGEPDSVPGTYLVAAYEHASGTVVGQVRAAGKGHELAAAKALLKHVPLAGRVVTADALLTQRDISEQIVTDRGDYLFPIDDNQPALLADAEAALSPLDRRGAAADGRANGRDTPTGLAPA
jgi:DDE_Tnp_1-associated/Transposase DDE domain